ncbi:MAG: Do family serine endopeptidase [Rickettsiaceae bacterium]|nr:Do family serine endopeptidase [Rickettsiaceae bacterium]MDP4832927.1 Do family serine endopeptidase [Rickettsiaceae bacterium]MDP5020744.1 Do family serine endopeptidase [Rickettsiaceae bacterium]MDP5083467.1 Do family serine endopeptidase [Rickettsiaceae bacterium]
MQQLKAAFFSIFLFYAAVPVYASAPVHITSFADIVEPLMPTVVNVYTVKHISPSDAEGNSLPEIIPFEQFNNFFERFNVPFSFDGAYVSPRVMSLGSGFIVDEDGYIITNNHVVADSDEIHVKLSDGVELPAIIIGTDPKTDLALLKIDTKEKLPAVSFASSSKTRVGDVVIAIGNPLGFGGTVTTGIISSQGRDLGINQDELVDDFIQTDAAINTGNSGGPLFNIEGKVIGLNTSIPDVGGGTNIGIGFAIPAHTVQDIMNQLKEKGKISRGRLDIAIQEVTKELAEALSLSKTYGVLIVDVRAGGAGDKAGLKRGDLITEFNDQMVLNSRKLQLFVADIHIGEKVKLTVVRDNKPIDLVAKIVEFEQPKEETVIEKETTLEKSGIVFANLSPVLITKFGLNEGAKGIVVVEVGDGELNFDLRVGDLITAINQQQISDIEQFDSVHEKIKGEKKQSVVLLVKRGEITMFVALPIK